MRVTRRDTLLGLAAHAATPMSALAQTPAFTKGAIIRPLFRDYEPDDIAGGATLFLALLSLWPDFLVRFCAASAAVLAAEKKPPPSLPPGPPPAQVPDPQR